MLAQLDLWANKDTYKTGVYRLPKKLDEEVARLHLEKIGVKLTKLSKKQADYLGVPSKVLTRPTTTATKTCRKSTVGSRKEIQGRAMALCLFCCPTPSPLVLAKS